MILLLLAALLLPTSRAWYINSVRSHLSDSLRLKCDALPYRTVFVGTRCYFAVEKEVKYAEASAQCNTVYSGSTVAGDVPATVFNAMMLDRKKFHGSKDSEGNFFISKSAKQSICTYESGYKCDAGQQSKVIPGKCLDVSTAPKDLRRALSYCMRQGMELASIGNDLENQMIRGAVTKQYLWINNIFEGFLDKKWHRVKNFGRYSVCVKPPAPRLAGWQYHISWGRMSSVMDRSGYWGTDGLESWYEAVCVKDAENEFTEMKCVANHEFDKETGQCEWTGPKDACLQAIDYQDKKVFLKLENFPAKTYREFVLIGPQRQIAEDLNDIVVSVVVRRGCMFTGFGGGPAYENQVMGNNDLLYGQHNVPCHDTGELPTWGDGVSDIKCFCDPTEATLNDHEPGTTAKKRCVEHHVFSEETKHCEWKHNPKYCGELITTDGRRQMVEIPNWPTNRKYSEDHWSNETKRAEDFHEKITGMIVRQHCWATLYHMTEWNSAKTLDGAGYGRHEVGSFYNGQRAAKDHGTHRVVCECMR